MTEAEIALAREAVACKHWDLLPGMLMDQRGLRVRWDDGKLRELFANDLPVFSDDATKGCLLALVRRAWPAECPAHVARGDSGVWRAWIGERIEPHSIHHHSIGAGPTEAAALVAALKAAP